MGGNTGKLILCLDTGVAGTGSDLIHIPRMPGEGRVALREHAVSCHKCFRSGAFLTRTAVKNYLTASLTFFFQIFLDGKSRSHGPSA